MVDVTTTDFNSGWEGDKTWLWKEQVSSLLALLRAANMHHVPLNASIPRPFTLLDLLLSRPDLGRACHSPYLVANLSALWE